MTMWLRHRLVRLANVARRALAVSTLGVVVGGLSSLVATGFVSAVEWLNDRLWISPQSRIPAEDWAWLPLATIVILAAGGLIAGAIQRWIIPGGRAHSPTEAIQAAQDGSGHVDLRTGAGSALVALTALGTGASVGKYGPLVHMGATIGSVLGRFTPASGGPALGLLGIGCGVASAIATAFDAPIAGVLFAHEVVLRHYSLRAFAPITVAAITGYALATFVFDREPLFQIPGIPQIAPVEFIAFIVLGIAAAFVAITYMRAILTMERVSERSAIPPLLRPATAGVLVGIMAIWVPEILGLGEDTLRLALTSSSMGPIETGVILVAKIAATALCLGFGFIGGVFSPVLLIGALFGSLAGYAAAAVLPQAVDSMGVYAICGLAAVTSPVIGGPLATILIVLELTRNYVLTIAVMMSVVFSNLVSYRLFGRSLFDETLRERGYDLSLGRDQLVLSRKGIGQYISQDYVHLAPGDGAPAACQRIAAADESEGHVLDAEGRYLGTVTLAALTRAQAAHTRPTTAGALAERADAILSPDASIWGALAQAQQGTARELPVLTEEGHMLGVIDRQALVAAYRKALFDIRREEHAAP